MSSNAVATRERGVPALAQPRLELGAEDVALPRLYIGQFMSKAVQEGLVKMGDVYAALGAEDPDPTVVYKAGDKEGVKFHVLGLRKGKSLSEGGDLQTWAFDDPSAPPEAWTTYSYFVALPDIDEDVPYRLLLTRTGTPAAKQINMVLLKNEAKGASWLTAFSLTTVQKENAKGKFAVARVAPVTATKKGIGIAEALAVVISGRSADVAARGEEPAI